MWVVAVMLLSTQLLAVTANPEMVKFRQPDEKIIVNIFLKGDEKVHWAETEDGYSLIHNDEGAFVYAYHNERGDLMPSEFMATNINERPKEVVAFLENTPKHLHFSEAQVKELLDFWEDASRMANGPKTMTNVLGEKHFLVILFAFQDQGFTHRKSEFKNLLNQVNYQATGIHGSVHDYYYATSGGQFSIHFDVAGPYTGIYNTAHYGNTNNGYQDFAEEAVDSASRDVDFSKYDNDHDGYIDGLHIIFAGYGEEAGASADHIWSHKWNIFSEPEYNNTIVNVYSCSPECSGYYGTAMTGIGVICHELGHVFGAPDYYDTDYSGSGGEYSGNGKWDIMSSGSWNNGGSIPAQHNPYTKIYIYKWADVDTLDATQKVSLKPSMISNNDFYRVNTGTNGDFFLIENRQQIGFDAGVPNHGMIVYHMHPQAHGANVSNAKHPQQMYPVAKTSVLDTFPNSTPSSYGDINLATLPLNGERDSLTDFSVPAFRPWNRAINHSPITFISEDDETGIVYFCFKGASPTPDWIEAEGVDRHTIRLDWGRYGNSRTLVLMSEDGVFGTLDSLYRVGDTVPGGGRVVYMGYGNMAVIDSLNPDVTYYFRAFTMPKSAVYSDGIDCQGQTLACNIAHWQNVDFEQNALPDCWTADGWHHTSTISHNGRSCFSNANATGETRLASAPFTLDSVQPSVLTFYANFDNQESTDPIYVLYRAEIASHWDTVATVLPGDRMSPWQRVYAFLPAAGNHSTIAFVMDATNGNHASIDDISIANGYLLTTYTEGHGSISPNGVMFVNEGDSIVITLRPDNGYCLRKLYVDGNSVKVTDTTRFPTYVLGVTGCHTVYATFRATAGIENVETATLRLYPNPTNGLVSVETDQYIGETLALFDRMGRKVMTQKVADELTRIDLGGLPNGLYLLRVGNATVKVIKMK